MIDLQEDIRDKLLQWIEQPEIAKTINMKELALRIGLAERTVVNFLYHNKPIKIRSLCLIKSFLKSPGDYVKL